MSKKLTTEFFIERAKKVHGDKYNYSKVEYLDCYTPVCIICPKHGEFWQKPKNHLIGRGCQKCGLIHRNIIRKETNLEVKVYGVGINDVIAKVQDTEYYNKWLLMLYRCYHPTQKEYSKSYNEVFVCDEWLRLSNFKEWFENPENGYKDGYQLDKDLLVKGNKIYSPQTCCFLPQEINSIIKLGNNRGKYPIGVIKIKQGRNKPYRADIKNRTIGYYATPEEAFFAYKKEKEKEVKAVALKYFQEGKITEKVYTALMNFNLEIND